MRINLLSGLVGTVLTMALTTGLIAAQAAPAAAAYITSFAQISNDGVYTLSASLATSLGVSGADRIGAIGIRTTSTPPLYTTGDTFDATSLQNSVLSNGSAIKGFLNGSSSSAGYTGGTGASLGTTTINGFDRASDQKLFDAAFFAFSSASGNIVFNGTSTFNGTTNIKGDFSTVVPVPAALPLLASALAGLGLLSRRRRRQGTAAAAA